MDRRRFLRVVGTGSTAAFAGCGGNRAGTESGNGSDSGGGTDGAGDSDGGGTTPIGEHPAAVGLADQPALGDTGGHVVLAFEDPSCPNCARFHQEIVPEIRENVVDPGKGAYVFRTYPVVYDWGKPATRALEATYARDADAHWALLGHYFAEQSGFSADDVLEETATFLDGETAVEGAAVVDAVQAGDADDAVQADLDAAEEAGLGGTTPTVLLFRDGEYVTTATGSISYEVIARALGE